MSHTWVFNRGGCDEHELSCYHDTKSGASITALDLRLAIREHIRKSKVPLVYDDAKSIILTELATGQNGTAPSRSPRVSRLGAGRYLWREPVRGAEQVVNLASGHCTCERKRKPDQRTPGQCLHMKSVREFIAKGI